jgi:hypothetical protein
MNIKQDIMQHAEFTDRPILIWLFEHYHMASQWGFVADCTFQRYGRFSYEINRIWKPTKEGYILYNNKEALQ